MAGDSPARERTSEDAEASMIRREGAGCADMQVLS